MGTRNGPAYAEDGEPKRRYLTYHEEKAKGGVALSIFGGCTMSQPTRRPWSSPPMVSS